jgi:hypothetical protein
VDINSTAHATQWQYERMYDWQKDNSAGWYGGGGQTVRRPQFYSEQYNLKIYLTDRRMRVTVRLYDDCLEFFFHCTDILFSIYFFSDFSLDFAAN